MNILSSNYLPLNFILFLASLSLLNRNKAIFNITKNKKQMCSTFSFVSWTKSFQARIFPWVIIVYFSSLCLIMPSCIPGTFSLNSCYNLICCYLLMPWGWLMHHIVKSFPWILLQRKEMIHVQCMGRTSMWVFNSLPTCFLVQPGAPGALKPEGRACVRQVLHSGALIVAFSNC